MERIQEIERRYEEFQRCIDIADQPPQTLNAGVGYNDACLSLDTIRLQMPADIEYLLAENRRLRESLSDTLIKVAMIDVTKIDALNRSAKAEAIQIIKEALREEGK